MEKILVNRLIRLISSLSIESKLEILSNLSEVLKIDFKPKNSKKDKLLNELSGSWSTVSEKVTDDIMNSRTSSNREISFD